jgi:hypothetical protein
VRQQAAGDGGTQRLSGEVDFRFAAENAPT